MNYRKPLIIIVVLLVITTTAFLGYRYFFTLYITSTNPGMSSVSYQSPSIELNFNKDVDASTLEIDDPNSIFYQEKTVISGKQITLRTNVNNLPLKSEVEFTIQVSSKEKGYSLSQTIKFTPQDISYDNLPDSQKKQIMKLQDNKPDYYRDPILDKLPHSTLEYEIAPNFISDSNEPEGSLTFDVTVFLTNVDIKEGRDAAINRYYDNALAYLDSIKTKGKDYPVNLIVQEP